MTLRLFLCQTIWFFAFLTIAVKESRSLSRQKNPNHHHHGWNFLLFTQQWPAVACLSWKMLNSSHKCNITKEIKTWTVHGIWPSSYHKDSPSFCNNSLLFDPTEIQRLKPKLYIFWPNIFANTPEDQLWAHEWNKHGTCAAQLLALDTEDKFFSQGLNWSSQYDMLSILADYGISPNSDNPVMAYDIKQAILKKLNVLPLLICAYIPKQKTYYIYELEICFNKKLELINCPSNALSMSPIGSVPCPDKELVWYPEIEYKTPLREPKDDDSNWFKKLLYFTMTVNKYFP